MTDVAPRRALSVLVVVSPSIRDVDAVYEDYRRILGAAVEDLEFVFVLDGPNPSVRQQLIRRRGQGEAIQIVQVARHAGEASCTMLGAREAAHDRLLLLPPYHELEPEALGDFVLEGWESDVAVAVRDPRSDGAVSQAAGRAFGAIVRWLTREKFEDIGCPVRLVRRNVLDEISLYGDLHRFLPVLARQRGFRVSERRAAQARSEDRVQLHGPGHYLRRLLDLLAVFFVGKFTKKPLRFFGLVGSFLIGIGGIVLAFVVFERLLFDVSLATRPALLLSVLSIVVGLQSFALGLLGELIIFTHAAELKEYAVAETVNLDEDQRRQVSGDGHVVPDRRAEPGSGGAGIPDSDSDGPR
jgi:hypothetical protein